MNLNNTIIMNNNFWYQNLTKPPFTPPAAYFPIAWGVLYTLMLGAFLIILFKPSNKDKYIAINLFFLQFFFNLIWSYLFFEMKSVNLALADIILLLITVLYTISYFFKLSKISGILMLPYLLQIFFALYLTIGIKILN